MAEPSSNLSAADLILRVAEFAGIPYYGSAGTSKVLIPIDFHDLDQCLRIVNDGIRRFISSEPPEAVGWRWRKRMHAQTLRVSTSSTATGGTATTLADSTITTFADDYYNDTILEIIAGTGAGETALVTDYTKSTGTYTFTALSGGSTPDTTSKYIVGHRYKMPDDFAGTPDGEITYIPKTNIGTPIAWRHETEIRQWIANASDSTGEPFMAALRPFGTRQHELVVYPRPSTLRLITFPFTVLHTNLQMASGLANSGSATTLVDSARTEEDDDFKDQVLTIVAGQGVGETATITVFTQASGTFTFSALSGGSSPNSTSVYNVEPATGNTHPAGMLFDDAIRGACLAETESQMIDVNAGKVQEFEQIILPRAYVLDSRLAPRKLGNLTRHPITRRVSHVNRTDVDFQT